MQTGESEGLSAEALLGLSLSFFLASLAERLTANAAIYFRFDPAEIGFTDIGEVSLLAAVGLTPVIAAVIRNQPVWRSLIGGQLFMLFGVVSLLVETEPTAPALSLAFTAVGRQIVAAALLIAAWRARPPITALLAGVFVIPGLLYVAVSSELFRNGWPERGLLLWSSLVLLLVGIGAVFVVFTGETVRSYAAEPGFPLGDITGLSLVLTGLIHLSGISRSGSEQWDTPGLLAVLVGGIVIGFGRQNRKTPSPVPQVDHALLVFFSASVMLTTLVSFGLRWLPFGTISGVSMSAAAGRATSLVLIVMIVPLIAFFARTQRRLLAIGTLAIAAAGVITLVFQLPDLQVGVIDSVAFTMLLEWGSRMIIGATIATSLYAKDNASIEFGVIFFLGFYAIIRELAANLGLELITADLLDAGDLEGDASDSLRLFLIASVVGLLALSAWWALRSDAQQGAIDVEDGELIQ